MFLCSMFQGGTVEHMERMEHAFFPSLNGKTV